MNKTELLQALQRDWDALQAVVASVDETAMLATELDDGLSVKDVLAHIAVWEARCASWLESVAHGVTPDRPDVKNVDASNARDYAAAKDATLASVLEQSRDAHAAMVHAVGALSEADLADEVRFGWPTWKMASSNSDEHYREHIEQIRAWLVRQAAP